MFVLIVEKPLDCNVVRLSMLSRDLSRYISIVVDPVNHVAFVVPVYFQCFAYHVAFYKAHNPHVREILFLENCGLQKSIQRIHPPRAELAPIGIMCIAFSRLVLFGTWIHI